MRFHVSNASKESNSQVLCPTGTFTLQGTPSSGAASEAGIGWSALFSFILQPTSFLISADVPHNLEDTN